jgi:pimeloyl-ACP methyl ester carboxylesterase
MMPFSILRIWLFGILGLAIAIAAGYLAYDWYRYDRDEEQLYWAIGLGAFSLLGRFVFMPFMGMGGGPPRLAPVDTRRVTRPDGTSLHVNYLQRGAGPVVVLTHGWSLNSSIWGYAQRELPDDCEVIAWDLRGLGESSKSPANDYSIETMAGDLSAVIELADGRPVTLVGHSIGGMICQTFCRLYPEQLGTTVSAIALCETTYTNPVRTAIFAPLWMALQKPLIEPLLHLTVWLSPVVWLMNIQSYLNGTTQLTTRISSFAGKQTWGQVDFASRLSSFASPAVMARGMLAMLKFDETTTLPGIHAPVTIIAGQNDRLTRPDANGEIARRAPEARLELLEPAGHLSILERHDRVNDSISRFIESQQSTRSTIPLHAMSDRGR